MARSVSKTLAEESAEKGRGDTPLHRGGSIPPEIRRSGVSPQIQKPLTSVELHKLVATLSAKEKKELFSRLSLDINTETKRSAVKSSDRDLELWVSAVQEQLSKALGDAAGGSIGTEVIKRVLRDADAIEPVMKVMTSAKLDGKPPAERLVMFRYLAELLVAAARRVANYTQAPLTPKFVANYGQHMAAIFDAAFPGYLASGLAGVVAAQLIRKAGREHTA